LAPVSEFGAGMRRSKQGARSNAYPIISSATAECARRRFPRATTRQRRSRQTVNPRGPADDQSMCAALMLNRSAVRSSPRKRGPTQEIEQSEQAIPGFRLRGNEPVRSWSNPKRDAL
jgi:hypothetical protein